jgi:hypothetical protein
VKRTLDKWIVLGLLLVLLTGTVAAQDGIQYGAYESWRLTSSEGQIAYVVGIMTGSYYIAVTYALENQGKIFPNIDHLIPHGADAGELQSLVNQVYRDVGNRQIAVVAIVCNWRKYYAIYGGF